MNDAEDGTKRVEQILNQHEGKSGGSGGNDEKLSLPKENMCGGPTAQYLLYLLGMLPKEEERR